MPTGSIRVKCDPPVDASTRLTDESAECNTDILPFSVSPHGRGQSEGSDSPSFSGGSNRSLSESVSEPAQVLVSLVAEFAEPKRFTFAEAQGATPSDNINAGSLILNQSLPRWHGVVYAEDVGKNVDFSQAEADDIIDDFVRLQGTRGRTSASGPVIDMFVQLHCSSGRTDWPYPAAAKRADASDVTIPLEHVNELLGRLLDTHTRADTMHSNNTPLNQSMDDLELEASHPWIFLPPPPTVVFARAVPLFDALYPHPCSDIVGCVVVLHGAPEWNLTLVQQFEVVAVAHQICRLRSLRYQQNLLAHRTQVPLLLRHHVLTEAHASWGGGNHALDSRCLIYPDFIDAVAVPSWHGWMRLEAPPPLATSDVQRADAECYAPDVDLKL